jgi:hypothetical protein
MDRGRPKEVKRRGFHLGNNETPWYTVGLSVMATQASAITFIDSWTSIS